MTILKMARLPTLSRQVSPAPPEAVVSWFHIYPIFILWEVISEASREDSIETAIYNQVQLKNCSFPLDATPLLDLDKV